MTKKHFNFRLEEDLQTKFKEKAVREGTTPTALLTRWIENYCNDNGATTQQQPATTQQQPATTVSNDNIEERIQRLETEDELNAALFGGLNARLMEVEAKLATVTQRQQVTTEEDECNDNDNNSATTEENESNDSDSGDATTGEDESNDNNFYEELREDFLKVAGIDEQKVIARDISTELNCGFRKALNRVQGKPKKRLDEMDEKIEEAIEKYHQERLEL